MSVIKQLKITFQPLLKVINLDEESLTFTNPPQAKLGNFSTNVVLIALKKHKQIDYSQVNQAIEMIKKSLLIQQIDFLKPGFINVQLSASAILQHLEWATNEFKVNASNLRNIGLEYVSANPTGNLHLAHARHAAIGSTLANLLKNVGHNLTSYYYLNDAGNQINRLTLSVLVRYLQQYQTSLPMLEDGYMGEEIVLAAKELQQKYGDKFTNEDPKKFDDKNPNFQIVWDFAVEFMLNRIKTSLAKFGVQFDHWISERELLSRPNAKQSIIELFSRSQGIYQKDGATWLNSTKYGDDQDRVLVKSDGSLTYMYADFLNHMEKLKGKHDQLINLFCADHFGYQSRLKAGLIFAGYEKVNLDIIFMQMVKIRKDNEEIKLSKRSGKSYTMDTLIEDIGVDQAKWFLIQFGYGSHVTIDLDVVLKKSEENHLYYVQYAYARCHQLLNLATKKTYLFPTEVSKQEVEHELLNHLFQAENSLLQASETLEVHRLTNYLYELAQKFHRFYSQVNILQGDESLIGSRLLMCKSVMSVIRKYFAIIGIVPVEKMD